MRTRVEKEQNDTTEYEMEPEVMEAEVERAIKQLKDNKSTGTGRDTYITDESWRKCDDKNKKKLQNFEPNLGFSPRNRGVRKFRDIRIFRGI